MQEKYVGDTPDFGKYALLRALCVGSDDRAPLRLGVNRYLTHGHDVFAAATVNTVVALAPWMMSSSLPLPAI